MKQSFHFLKKLIIRIVLGLSASLAVLLVLVVGLLNFLDLNQFKPELEAYAKEFTGRELHINGTFSLDLGLPSSIEATDVVFQNASWAKDKVMVEAGVVKLSLSLVDLFKKELSIRAFTLKNARIIIEEQTKEITNWQFKPETKKVDKGSAFAVNIDNVIIKDTMITYHNHQAGSSATHSIEELSIKKRKDNRLSINGKGSYESLFITLDGSVSSLFNIMNGNIIYNTNIKTDRSVFDINLEIKKLQTTPKIKAIIKVDNLYLNDFIQESEDKKPKSSAVVSSEKVLSDIPFDLSSLAKIKADITVEVDKLVVKEAEFSALNTHIALDKGAITIKPFQVNIAGGKILGDVAYNTNEAPQALDFSILGEHITVGKILQDLAIFDSISDGALSFVIKGKGVGKSSHQIATTLDGEVNVYIEEAKYHNSLDIVSTEGFFRLLTGEKEGNSMNINCAAAIFAIAEGTAKSKAMVLDATGAIVTGKGKIKLGDEKLALSFTPKAKLVGLADLATPMKLGGTFRNPKFFPDPKGMLKTLGKVAIGVATGGASTLGVLALGMVDKLGIASKKNSCLTALSYMSQENPSPKEEISTTQPSKKTVEKAN